MIGQQHLTSEYSAGSLQWPMDAIKHIVHQRKKIMNMSVCVGGDGGEGGVGGRIHISNMAASPSLILLPWSAQSV